MQTENIGKNKTDRTDLDRVKSIIRWTLERRYTPGIPEETQRNWYKKFHHQKQWEKLRPLYNSLLAEASKQAIAENPELKEQIESAQLYAINWIKIYIDKLPPTPESLKAIAAVLSVLNALNIDHNCFPAIHGHERPLR